MKAKRFHKLLHSEVAQLMQGHRGAGKCILFGAASVLLIKKHGTDLERCSLTHPATNRPKGATDINEQNGKTV